MSDEREPEFAHIHCKAKTAELLQKRITMHQELGFELVSVVPVASGLWLGEKVWHAFMKQNTARRSSDHAQTLE